MDGPGFAFWRSSAFTAKPSMLEFEKDGKSIEDWIISASTLRPAEIIGIDSASTEASDARFFL